MISLPKMRLILLALILTFPLSSAMAEGNPLERWKHRQSGSSSMPPSLSPPPSSSAPPPPLSSVPAPVTAQNAPAEQPMPANISADQPYEPDTLPTQIIASRVKKNRPLTYEESQEVMLNSLPTSKVSPPPASNAAFKAMMQKNMPMTPKQILELRQQMDLMQRVAAVPAVVPPKPVSTTLMVNLAPGSTPPAVRLAAGYVSSLVFVDSAGSPWPIASFDIGNPTMVNIQWESKSNILLLQAKSSYSNGDIVVRLVGLPTPVTLELVAGQRVVDYRVDLHVSGLGPNAKDAPVASSLPNSANQVLLDVLDGVAPAGSKLLSVKGADCQAWQLGNTLFLRTRLTVLSPGWMGKMVSPDGMQAYELPKTSSVLVSRFGEPAELKIEGY